MEAFQKASRGKRGKQSTARFEIYLADHLLEIQAELRSGDYQPGEYVHFMIHDPKKRRISAAPFRDRVVHHALCNLIEPIFESSFISDSYANRIKKGTHRAIDRLQYFARKYRYVLRIDLEKFFPAIDHQILLGILSEKIQDSEARRLVRKIISSGEHILDSEYQMVYFPGDNLFSIHRPRGLPIGNLTSQFWANCYLNPFDHFVKRELRCKAYLRYVDDFALFSNDKKKLWAWKAMVIQRLADFRLTVHQNSAQVTPVTNGIPWLGFIVYPTHRKLKSRNVVKFTRRLRQRWDHYCDGEISFAEFDASVQGWINHVRYADSWGLRTHLLGKPLIKKSD